MALSSIPLKGLGFSTQKFCAGPVALKYRVHQQYGSRGATSLETAHLLASIWQSGSCTKKESKRGRI